MQETSSRKRILFIHGQQSRSGASKLALKIAEHLKSEFQISMVCLRSGSMRSEFERIFENIIYPTQLGKSRKINLSDLAGRIQVHGKIGSILRNIKFLGERIIFPTLFKKQLRKVNPDLVYVNGIACHQAAKVAHDDGMKVLYHIHELSMGFGALNPKERANFKNVADVFIASSARVKKYLIETFQCAPEQILIVNSFIDHDQLQLLIQRDSDKDYFSNLNINQFSFFALGVGTALNENHVLRKGIDLFTLAAKKIGETEQKNVRFVWLGEVDERAVNDACGLNAKDYVTFLGEISNPYPLIEKCNIFVMPSREEAFGLVALEAMALGNPVALFDGASGIANVIGNSHFLVATKMTADALFSVIYQAIIDESSREKLGIQGILQAKRFNAIDALAEISQIVTGVIGSRKRL